MLPMNRECRIVGVELIACKPPPMVCDLHSTTSTLSIVTESALVILNPPPVVARPFFTVRPEISMASDPEISKPREFSPQSKTVRDAPSAEVTVTSPVDPSVDPHEDVCVPGSTKIDRGVDGEDVVAASADPTESHGVAKEPQLDDEELVDASFETRIESRASITGIAVGDEDAPASVSVADLMRYTMVFGADTPEKTLLVPADAATVVRVGVAHVARFAESHASIAYATTSLDVLADHASVISFAPVRRAYTSVGAAGPVGGAGVVGGDPDDEEEEPPWFASAATQIASPLAVVLVTEHALANETAPALCVASSAVVTPSQKHPFAFHSVIAAQHADPPPLAHGARSLAFVVQCVPGSSARAAIAFAHAHASTATIARRLARAIVTDASPRAAFTEPSEFESPTSRRASSRAARAFAARVRRARVDRSRRRRARACDAARAARVGR